LGADGVRKIILVTHASHLGRAAHEYTAAGFTVIPAPVGMLAARESRLLGNLPDAEALLRSQMAIYEMLGDPVRAFLTATHLRHH
jgi:uncharacterized SAM-binding protein YcdF (DUF218 family)